MEGKESSQTITPLLKENPVWGTTKSCTHSCAEGSKAHSIGRNYQRWDLEESGKRCRSSQDRTKKAVFIFPS